VVRVASFMRVTGIVDEYPCLSTIPVTTVSLQKAPGFQPSIYLTSCLLRPWMTKRFRQYAKTLHPTVRSMSKRKLAQCAEDPNGFSEIATHTFIWSFQSSKHTRSQYRSRYPHFLFNNIPNRRFSHQGFVTDLVVAK